MNMLRYTFALLVFVVAFAIVTTAPVAGQGTDGLVTEPFRSRDFNREVRRLKLDWPQRIAVEREHERYKENYAAFRDGELTTLTKRLAEMQSGNMAMPKRKDVEEMLRLRQTAINRVMELDRQLFEAMAAHLRADQVNALEHIRRARERMHYDSEITRGPMGDNFVNLVSVLDRVNLSDADWQAIDEALVDYEISSNRAIKVAHDKTISMFVDLFKVLEEMGLGNMSDQDPSQMMQYMEAMQKAMAKVGEDAANAAKTVRTLTDRSFETIAMNLTGETREAFRVAYLKEAYPDVYSSDPDSPAMMFAISEGFGDAVPADVAQSIRDLKDGWSIAHDAICRRMMVAVDEHREKSIGFFGMNDAEDDYWERMSELTEERANLNRRTADNIVSLISDDELRGQIERGRGAEHDHEAIGRFMAMTTDGVSVSTADVAIEEVGGEMVMQTDDGDTFVVSNGSFTRRMDAMLPGPISISEFRIYADRLGLAEDRRLIAEDFLEDYRAEFDRVSTDQVLPMITEAQQSMWTDGQWNAGGAKLLADARRRALKRLMDVDRLFFDDLGSLLSDEERSRLPQVELARECEAYDVSDSAQSWYNPANPVNLAGLLVSVGLEAADVRAIAPLLAEYDRERLPVLKDQYESSMRRDLAQAEAQQAMQASQQAYEQDPAAAMQGWQRYQEIMQPINESLEKLSEKRSELDRTFSSRFVEALSTTKGERLAQLIRRQSYPSIWPDREDASRAIERALTLPGISNVQRGQLEIIYADHVDRHESLSNELMELEDSGSQYPNFTGSNIDEVRDWQQRQQRMQVVRYLREEWNETARRNVRALLTEEQAKKVPGLDPTIRMGARQWFEPGQIVVEEG